MIRIYVLTLEALISPPGIQFGNRLKVYGMERTICDMMSSRSRIDIQIFNYALKRFVRLKSVDYMLLMEYAKAFHVERG